jgi:hypothetical protein
MAERTAEVHTANDEVDALRRVATLVAQRVASVEIFRPSATRSARPPVVLAGDVNGRDGKPSASVKYPKASARCASIWRRRLARSAATISPQTPCWPTSQCRSESARHWLRTGQSLQMAIAAAASCRACRAPG